MITETRNLSVDLLDSSSRYWREILWVCPVEGQVAKRHVNCPEDPPCGLFGPDDSQRTFLLFDLETSQELIQDEGMVKHDGFHPYS